MPRKSVFVFRTAADGSNPSIWGRLHTFADSETNYATVCPTLLRSFSQFGPSATAEQATMIVGGSNNCHFGSQ